RLGDGGPWCRGGVSPKSSSLLDLIVPHRHLEMNPVLSGGEPEPTQRGRRLRKVAGGRSLPLTERISLLRHETRLPANELDLLQIEDLSPAGGWRWPRACNLLRESAAGRVAARYKEL